MTVPTSGEAYAKLMEFLRKAQEECATLAHLENANDKRRLAIAWLAVAENMRKMQHMVTQIAMGKMH
jgi:hypothetical protein